MKLSKLSNQGQITFLIAQLDAMIQTQLSKILHIPEVDSLLSIWSEINLICQAATSNKFVLIKILNVSWHEIDKDINASFELENSILYSKICEDEFGVAGGEPFGILLANYELDIRKLNVISTLNRLCELGSLALAPIFANLSNTTLALSSDTNANIDKEIVNTDLTHWQKFRKTPHARFLYLNFPRTVLSKLSVAHEFYTINNIVLRTTTLLAIRTIQSFNESHWFSDILGFFDATNLNTSMLPLTPNNHEVHLNCSVYLKSKEEGALTDHGFLPLMQSKRNAPLYFGNIYSSYADNNASGLLLEHMLAACRFGHLIKVIARQKIGSLTSETECEQYINQWLNRYTGTFQEQSLRAKFPLKKHLVKIHKIPGKIGCYACQILLEPHMKIENLNAQIILHSEIYTPN